MGFVIDGALPLAHGSDKRRVSLQCVRPISGN